MASIPGLGGVHPLRAVVALVAVIAVVVIVTTGEPVAAMELAAYVLAAVGLVGLSFDRVRESPKARFAQTSLLAVALVLIYLAPPRTLFQGVVAAVAVVAILADGLVRMTGVMPEDVER